MYAFPVPSAAAIVSTAAKNAANDLNDRATARANYEVGKKSRILDTDKADDIETAGEVEDFVGWGPIDLVHRADITRLDCYPKSDRDATKLMNLQMGLGEEVEVEPVYVSRYDEEADDHYLDQVEVDDDSEEIFDEGEGNITGDEAFRLLFSSMYAAVGMENARNNKTVAAANRVAKEAWSKNQWPVYVAADTDVKYRVKKGDKHVTVFLPMPIITRKGEKGYGAPVPKPVPVVTASKGKNIYACCVCGCEIRTKKPLDVSLGVYCWTDNPKSTKPKDNVTVLPVVVPTTPVWDRLAADIAAIVALLEERGFRFGLAKPKTLADLRKRIEASPKWGNAPLEVLEALAAK